MLRTCSQQGPQLGLSGILCLWKQGHHEFDAYILSLEVWLWKSDFQIHIHTSRFSQNCLHLLSCIFSTVVGMGQRNIPVLKKKDFYPASASLLGHKIACKLACLTEEFVLLFTVQSLLMHVITLMGLIEVITALPLRSTLFTSFLLWGTYPLHPRTTQ